jgi:Ger(x)C family germination protein
LFKNIFLLFIFILSFTTIPGCWDGQDITDRSILLVGGLDLNETEELQFGQPTIYDVTVLTPNLEPQAPSKVRITTMAGSSIAGTRDLRAYINPKTFIPGIIKVELIGEKIAAKGVRPILDSLYRNPQTPGSVVMAVTEGRTDRIINTKPEDWDNVAILLEMLLEEADKRAFLPVTTLQKFISQASAKGKNPVVPLIRKENEDITISGTGIFNKDKLIAKISTAETRSLVLLRGLKATGYIPYTINRDKVIDRGTILVKNKRKVKLQRSRDEFIFQININLDGTLVDHENKQKFTDNKAMLEMIEEQVAADIKNECTQFIRKMQSDFKTDCIDISKYALAQWRKELEDQIDEGFIEKAIINVNVKVNLKNTGALN